MLPIGRQLINVLKSHEEITQGDAERRALELLEMVGMKSAEQPMHWYPHQLSGGQAQRVLIAMALINEPKLIIADEPTSGLDMTLQAEILDLMIGLVRRKQSAIWLITHDLGIVTNYCDRAAVMFAGQVVEMGTTETLFTDPQHPYTRGLIAAATAESQLDRDEASAIGGGPPELDPRPRGCQFAYRCPWVEDTCTTTQPEPEPFRPGHDVRCFVAHRRKLNYRDDRSATTKRDGQLSEGALPSPREENDGDS